MDFKESLIFDWSIEPIQQKIIAVDQWDLVLRREISEISLKGMPWSPVMLMTSLMFIDLTLDICYDFAMISMLWLDPVICDMIE